jgi:hypothetical protein
MSLQQRGESGTPAVEHEGRPTDAGDRAFNFSTPFFDSRTAAAYVPCKSVRAFYEFCRRHGITRRRNGAVAKVDIDRAMNRKRPRRAMATTSLANLRRLRRHE